MNHTKYNQEEIDCIKAKGTNYYKCEFEIDKTLFDEMKKIAKEENRDINDLRIEALSKFIGRHRSKK